MTIGTLAVDGWAVTFGTARRVLGGAPARPVPSSLYQNVTAHPSTASVPTSDYLMWHYTCLWTLKDELGAKIKKVNFGYLGQHSLNSAKAAHLQ